jgi:steroid delta-isomerase-like uncharacterized protein
LTQPNEEVAMASKVDAIRAAVDAFNAHDRDRYITVYRPDVALHGLPEGVVDAATLGDFYAAYWSGVSDARASIEDVFESGDKAVVRLRLTGTHDGELMGVPATGRPVDFELVNIVRFDDEGKITERATVADFLSLLQQIGAIPVAA